MRTIWIIGLMVMLAGCQSEEDAPVSEVLDLDSVAERYVRLALAMKPHDSAYVDAYFGPDTWAEEADGNPMGLDRIRDAAESLRDALGAMSEAQGRDIRAEGLHRRLTALIGRIGVLRGTDMDFDTETQLLYDTVAPDYEMSHFDDILSAVDALVPGDEPLAQRVEAFRQRFAIPPGRLATVFDAAIAECRRRTRAHMALPTNESFTIEYVNDKPWSGYNWYQGNSSSLIQVNTDLPIFIHRAVDLGCHEGYPGHHTYNALLEEHIVNQRGWVEFSLYPLFSPQSLIAEGSANYGIKLAFPGAERVAFEREQLFPLAGLDAAEADRYYRLLELLEELEYVDNEVARHYLDGEIDRETALDWLVRYRLMSPERAGQRLDFIDTYRSYVINYNHGRDLVADYIEAMSGGDPLRRWEAFEYLLSHPLTPSDLGQNAPE